MVAAFQASETSILGYQNGPPFTRNYLLDGPAVGAHCAELMERFDVRAPSPQTPTRQLSGGNVQKVLLAREMSGAPKVLVIASPTQGLDVGAVATVHQLLLEAAESGVGILLVSEDLEEVRALADRVAVIYEGSIMAVLDSQDATVDRLGLLMGGSRDIGDQP